MEVFATGNDSEAMGIVFGSQTVRLKVPIQEESYCGQHHRPNQQKSRLA